MEDEIHNICPPFHQFKEPLLLDLKLTILTNLLSIEDLFARIMSTEKVHLPTSSVEKASYLQKSCHFILQYNIVKSSLFELIISRAKS